MNSILGKVFGWAQFALTGTQQLAGNLPHGWVGWLTTAGSLLTAIAIHGASSTDGAK
jgi:hypothetical protein